MPPMRDPLAILAVEDERLNVDLLRLVFETEGIRMKIATTGAAAIEAAARGVVDLVLLNVQLPDIGGIEVARRIRSLSGRAARVPILGCSAFAATADEERALEAGMTAYLVKPAPPVTTLAAIRAVAATQGEIETPPHKVIDALLSDLGHAEARRLTEASVATLVHLGRADFPGGLASMRARLEELALSLRRLGLDRTAGAVADAAVPTRGIADTDPVMTQRIAGEAVLWRACALSVHKAVRDAARTGRGSNDGSPQG